MSPYNIRNLWTDQDYLLRRSGIKGGTGKKRIPPCVHVVVPFIHLELRVTFSCTDVKTNPLDPNQLLIGYAGGIVLYDLSEQRTIRTYEYLVLPGAPGGHNDQTEGAFLERRPSCMCLAWRPDGRMFASGHDDGSIVFWAVEDGDSASCSTSRGAKPANAVDHRASHGPNDIYGGRQHGDVFQLVRRRCAFATIGCCKYARASIQARVVSLYRREQRTFRSLHWTRHARAIKQR